MRESTLLDVIGRAGIYPIVVPNTIKPMHLSCAQRWKVVVGEEGRGHRVTDERHHPSRIRRGTVQNGMKYAMPLGCG